MYVQRTSNGVFCTDGYSHLVIDAFQFPGDRDPMFPRNLCGHKQVNWVVFKQLKPSAKWISVLFGHKNVVGSSLRFRQIEFITEAKLPIHGNHRFGKCNAFVVTLMRNYWGESQCWQTDRSQCTGKIFYKGTVLLRIYILYIYAKYSFFGDWFIFMFLFSVIPMGFRMGTQNFF